MDFTTRCWGEDELAACTFDDARLGQRLRRLVAQMDRSLGASLPFACQDWANTKAAYRFFTNRRVSEAQILSGHFAATRARPGQRRPRAGPAGHHRVHLPAREP